MVDTDAAQTPLLIVQAKTVVPVESAVACAAGSFTKEKDAFPETTDQAPEPKEGVLAFNVVLAVQIVCELPAIEAAGGRSCTIDTVDVETGQVPLEIVHTKLFAPVLSPVTPLVDEEALEIVAVPVLTDQSPVPIIGVFPASVAEEAQSVCDVPALEIVGFASLITVTVLLEEGQVPLDIVHIKSFIPVFNPVT
jgi:hypothetical protein